MRAGGALLLCAVALAACSSPEPAPDLTWREVTLPTAGATVRDVAFCDDHWLAVGGLPTGPVVGGPSTGPVVGGASTGPAAWRSTDGTTWTRVPLEAVSFYGKQSTISTVACRGAEAVAVGAASGGAHGNPRTSTWRSRPDGSWLEHEPAFTQFGGEEAVGVGAAAAALGSTAAWAIAGNWLGPDGSPGPALWHSADGVDFERSLVAPGSGARGTDVAPLADGGWLVTGEAYGATLTGASWVSRDGTAWTPVPVDGPLALATPYGDGTLAVGAGGAWWYDRASWERRGGFDARGWRFLGLAAVAGGRLGAMTAAAGGTCRMWTTRDGGVTWREVGMPVALPVNAETVAAVAVGGESVLLAAGGRLWLTSA